MKLILFMERHPLGILAALVVLAAVANYLDAVEALPAWFRKGLFD